MYKKGFVLLISILLIGAILLAVLLIPTNLIPPDNLGAVRLNIETYLAGKNQPTHPSAVYFPEAWNGSKYWLAYSPYPYGDGEEENPCVAISSDMLYWETPPGLANPVANNEETGCNELKDPHLLYRADLDRLEMWYLGRLSDNLGGDGTSLLLFRKYSYDGISWSNYEVMSPVQHLSPTIYWDGTKYQMWSIGYDLYSTTGTIVYQESVDGFVWSTPVLCSLGAKNTDIDIWHGSVTKHDGKYHLVFIDSSDMQEVFYCDSSDGVHFTEPRVIVENQGYWDRLYRPALMFDHEKVYCLYGVISHANQWFISMSSGTSFSNLTGLQDRDSVKMVPLSDSPTNNRTFTYRVRDLYRSVKNGFCIEILAFVAIETFLLFLIRKLRSKKFLLSCAAINLLMSFAYIYLRLRPVSVVSWVGFVIAVLCLNVGMLAFLQCIVTIAEKEVSGRKHVD